MTLVFGVTDVADADENTSKRGVSAPEDTFSLLPIQRAAIDRLRDPCLVSELGRIIDENPLFFGDFAGHREDLIRVLAQYNHAGSGIDDVAGMLDFTSDALAVSMMDDDRRTVFARELLAKFLPADTMVEEEDITVLLQAHHLHGDKDFWELSTTDKQEIRNLLATRPLFVDKHIQDYVMYHVVCGAGKGFLIGIVLAALVVAGLYFNGAFDPTPGPTTPIPEAPTAKTQEEAKAVVLDPKEIANSFLAQTPDYTYDLDTTRSSLTWRAIIDPEKGLTGGTLYRLKRSIEIGTGLGTAEFTLTSKFFSALGYRASDIASTRAIDGMINTSTPQSIIYIKGINGSNLTYSHFEAGEVVTETDWADWEDDADVRNYLNVARDSIAAMMREFALPASAFDSRVAQGIARMSGEKAVNAMFGMMGTLIPEIRNHAITVNMEFNFRFPSDRPGFTSGPGFTSAYNNSGFAGLGTPGARRVVTVAVTKPAGDLIYKAYVVSDTIADDGLLKN